MSCFLCNSLYHLTHNCDIYESDESRQEILISKNWCPNCFSFVSEMHAKKWDRCRAKNNKKCFICFSREHHTIFCPDRNIFPNMIIPAIDQDLHKRFFKLFKGLFLEEYFLAFLSKKMFDTINEWRNERPHYHLDNGLRVTTMIQLFDSIKNAANAKMIEEKQQSILFVTNEVNLDRVGTNSYIYKHILRPVFNFSIYFIPKKVILKNCDIPDKAFLKLLSHYTKVLECREVELTPSVELITIIKNAPNIQELILDEANMLIDNFWADNLLRYKNSDNFSKLEIEIKSYKFNVKSLVTFLKTKCVPNAQLKISINIQDNDDLGHKNELLDELSNYFVSEKKKRFILSVFTVQIDTHGVKNYRSFASFTNLKNET